MRRDPKDLPNIPDVVQLRRDLHAFPELGFLEYRTAAKVAELLEGLGWGIKVGPEVMRASEMRGRPQPAAIDAAQADALKAGAPTKWIERMPGGQTAVVAEMSRGEGPTLAFRFDMDALPVLEAEASSHAPQAGGFRSSRHGVMHACGHDGHTAIGICVGAKLATADWQGRIKLIFQPAEEGGRGAAPMVAAGVMDGVDHFFAAHLGCHLPTGQVAGEMTGFLFSKKFDVSFRGLAAHAAASPDAGKNALLAGAAAALGIHGIARPPGKRAVANVGRMVAGGARNIVADHCKLELEVRGNDDESLAYMARRMEEVVRGAAAMHDVRCEIELVGETVGAASSPQASSLVVQAAAGIDGVEALPSWAMNGGEDATFMMRAVTEHGRSAAYFVIGSDIPAPHHATDFDFDEDSLQHGVEIFTQIAMAVLAQGEVVR